MPHTKTFYTRLPDVEGPTDPSDLYSATNNGCSVHRRQLQIYLVVSVILNVVLALLHLSSSLPAEVSLESSHGVYSPAQSAVEYKVVKFTRGLGTDVPIYERVPSEAVDRAWEALWAFPETRIPKSEAQKLPNETWPLVGDSGHYLVSLDVLHQLHCLDMLRRQLHPGHNYTRLPMNHIRHCIGAIRQSLMCTSDISVVVWQWSETLQEAEQRDDVPHMCRDFSKIQVWAKEHHIQTDLDLTVYVDSNLNV